MLQDPLELAGIGNSWIFRYRENTKEYFKEISELMDEYLLWWKRTDHSAHRIVIMTALCTEAAVFYVNFFIDD